MSQVLDSQSSQYTWVEVTDPVPYSPEPELGLFGPELSTYLEWRPGGQHGPAYHSECSGHQASDQKVKRRHLWHQGGGAV